MRDDVRESTSELEAALAAAHRRVAELEAILDVRVTGLPGPHQQADSAPLDGHHLLEAVFDNAHLLIATLDTRFNFISVNRAYAGADEKSPDFFPGKNHFDLYPHAENEVIFRQVVATGEPYQAFAKPFEYADAPERGTTYWDWSLVPIKGKDGQVVALTLLLANVTERILALESAYQSEVRRQREEEKLAVTLSSLQETVFRSRLSGEVVWISPSVERLFGYSPAELSGTDATTLYESPVLRQDLLNALARQNGRINDFETTMKRKDGTVFWVSLNAHYAYDDAGNVAYVEGSIRDISEQKQARAAIHALAKNASADDPEAFFRECATNLAQVYGVRYVLIGLNHGEDRRSVRTCAVLNGDTFVDNFEYDLTGTPCNVVQVSGACFVPDGVTQAYPEDQLLADMGVESYLGAPLVSSSGEMLGLVAVMDTRPMEVSPWVEPVLGSFALRIAAEVERHRAGKLLQDASARFKSVIENTPLVAVKGYDRDGVIHHWNRASTELYGFSAEEALGRRIQDLLFADEDVAGFEQAIRDIWDSGEATAPREWKLRTRSGDPCWIYFTMVPVKRDGEVVELFCMDVDISARKAVEESLRSSETRLAEAQAIAHLGSWEWDVASPRLTWSAETFRIFGMEPSREQVRFVSILKRIHPDDRVRVRRAIRDAVQNDLPYAVEHRIIRPDGSERTVRQLALVEHDGLKPVRMVGAVQDVTELSRIAAEKDAIRSQLLQAQKMEAVGILAGGVAHDFNNLLTTISGYTELALEKAATVPGLTKDLKEVAMAAERAGDLTRQLLLFSRKQPLEFISIDLSSRIEDLLNMLVRIIGEDVEIYTDMVAGLWPVSADGISIDQLVMNLAINARDAMPEGGRVTIQAENISLSGPSSGAHPESRPGRYVRVTVSDTGVGMDEETLEHIFDPFFTTKELGKGTGLGMSVVHGIAKHHEGWIEVESAPGAGSRFTVYFPAIPDARLKPAVPKESRREMEGAGRRVLVVEDEEALRAFANVALSKSGYQVTACHTAEEALSIFRRDGDRFDLVFSDVVLPDKSGIWLAEELSVLRPGLPVLLSSGYPDQKSGWNVIQEKNIPFIQKPYSLPGLLAAVSGCLSVR